MHTTQWYEKGREGSVTHRHLREIPSKHACHVMRRVSLFSPVEILPVLRGFQEIQNAQTLHDAGDVLEAGSQTRLVAPSYALLIH